MMMNSQNFYTQLDSQKIGFTALELSSLKEVQKEFPYFQLAKMATLKAMHALQDKDFHIQLSQTASIVLSREVLFDFVFTQYSQPTAEPIAAKIPKEPLPKVEKIVEAKQSSGLQDLEMKSKADLMQQVKTRLAEIEAANAKETKDEVKIEPKSEQKIVDPIIPNQVIPKKPITKEASKKVLKTVDRGSSINIIDSFIKSNPGINKPENKDYSEEISLADQSIKENYDLVSETMARLYSEQGHAKKAIKIYEKLILIYPEKSTYFAARISELKV